MKRIFAFVFAALMLTLTVAVVPAARAENGQSVPADVLEYAENTALKEIKSAMRTPSGDYVGEGKLFATPEEVDALTIGSCYRLAVISDKDITKPLLERKRLIGHWLVTVGNGDGVAAIFKVLRYPDGKLIFMEPMAGRAFGDGMALMQRLIKSSGTKAEPTVLNNVGGFDIVASFNGDERVITAPCSFKLLGGYSQVTSYTELPTVEEHMAAWRKRFEDRPQMFDENGNQIIDIADVPLGYEYIELAPHLDPANASASTSTSTGESGVNALPFIIGAGVIVIAGVIVLGVVLGRRRTVRVK